MSKELLEERHEREQAEAVASALGISTDELDELDWRLEPHESDDGLLYGHNVYFGEGSDPEILKRIDGLVNGKWVRIGPL
ncbi:MULTISPECIES: hypothetical protein [unclassified Bradyrhizobium]|uniref:hypothetical protein n=1 Tax=unclassified Bradyrhizobium TaxID=2631580 RepID=UPI0004006C23|nr:hypothetical protein [Bradyrhizobium sp. th.b2]